MNASRDPSNTLFPFQDGIPSNQQLLSKENCQLLRSTCVAALMTTSRISARKNSIDSSWREKNDVDNTVNH